MLIRNTSELGILIRSARKGAGLTQADLAEKVDVSTRWIVEMERGKETAELRLVFRVLEGLGLLMDVSASSREPNRPTKLAAKARALASAQGTLAPTPDALQAAPSLKRGPSMTDVLARLNRKA
ncbi:helix-turn-helix transcriptional regulator [Teichococcus vastitatis]|jgi:y4mF family transcriptional regulator|uniref:helix-turn-helix transcriptional regulator n=1 Tax=Teichococcus vastitatis TaxID=2307076 RepID=UPI0034628C2C